jgi:hypothetical protein
MEVKLKKDELFSYAGRHYIVIDILPFDTHSYYYKLQDREFKSILYLLL